MASQEGNVKNGPAVGLAGQNPSTRTLRSMAAVAVLTAAGLVACGLSLGGCPGSPSNEPVSPTGSGTKTSNVSSPILSFSDPSVSTEATSGFPVDVSWTLTDAAYNAAYSVWIAPVSDPNTWLPPDADPSANKRMISKGFRNDIPGGKTVSFDPAGLATGEYAIRGIASNGLSPTARVAALGLVTVVPPGTQPRTRPPTVDVTAPTSIQAVIHGSSTRISWCARDPDSKAKVLVLLDSDDDPNNDVIFQTPAQIAAICGGTFPQQVNGAILLACTDEDDCLTPPPTGQASTTQPTAVGGNLDITIDVTKIPPMLNGEHWRVRVDVSDGRNTRVHDYAAGGIIVLGSVTGPLVDTGQIGRTLLGAVFRGTDENGRTGSSFCPVPDMNGDGASEFIIVSQNGRAFGRGPFGMVSMAYGRPQLRFGGRNLISSIGLADRIPGVVFGAPQADVSDGITSVAVNSDTVLDTDGRPDLIIGLPYIRNALWQVGCSPPSWNYYDYPVYAGWTDSFDASGYALYIRSTGYFDNRFVDLGQAGTPAPFVEGARFLGAWFDIDWEEAISPNGPFNRKSRFGQTVAMMPPLTSGSLGDWGIVPDLFTIGGIFDVVMDATGATVSSGSRKDNTSELLISGPMAEKERGQVLLFFGQRFFRFIDPESPFCVTTVPRYGCQSAPAGCTFSRPAFRNFIGSVPGDHLGFAGAAGDFNGDGDQDILMGAPGADRDGMVDNGVLYIVFGRVDIGNINAFEPNYLGSSQSMEKTPRFEMHGIHAGDELGEMQKLVNDMNGDGLPDIAFGVPKFDPPGLTDAGMVGVIFGGRFMTGENIFWTSQVATDQLPGVIFYGTQAGGLAGSSLASAGDFNGDGYGDLILSAPAETRNLNGQLRRGVAYVIFGGTHLYNRAFNLTQVGTTVLPGVVFVGPYAVGTADEAPILADGQWRMPVDSAGDADADGFGDILIGNPDANFVNPNDPSQRRIHAGEAYLIYGTNGITMANP